MVTKKQFNTTASLLVSLLIWAGFSTPVLANPIDKQLQSAAKELGLLRYVKQPAAPQQAPIAHKRPVQQPVKTDPYAAKRRQIHLQNIARKKAYNARLLQQKRAKYQRAHNKKLQQQKSHGNVWNRLYQGFQIRDYNRQPLVKKFTTQFSKNPKRIQRLADRSSQYLYMVVEELNRRRMPTELALLPFVESAYRNKAYSHAGAAGMWQFIPATGRRFGLQQTRSYDARLDPYKSTKAAFDYLQRLNREFRGDWLLALAAYNCGEFRVHREIAKNRARGKRTDYWSLNLPRETKQYVPRLLAFKEIFRNPSKFQVRLRGIPNTHALTEIQVNKPVDLKKAAVVAGLPADTLSSINSGFLHGITTPRHSNRIFLPRQYAGRLNQVIQRLPPAADVHNKSARKYYKTRKRSKRGRYVYHKVRRGDNLYRIAKRHGTSVKKLKRLNNLRSNKIKPGKRLKIASKARAKKRYS